MANLVPDLSRVSFYASNCGVGVVASKASSLGEIDAEPVSSALVSACHLGGGMAELLLHMALIDLCGGGEAGPQQMAGKERAALGLRQVAAHAGRQRRPLDETRHLLSFSRSA